MLRDREEWANLHTLIMVQAERTTPQQTTLETRFLSPAYPRKSPHSWLLYAVTGDRESAALSAVAFGEDRSRVRKDHAPHNLAILRHIALNLLKQESSAKVGLMTKCLRAGWYQAYLLQLLSH